MRGSGLVAAFFVALYAGFAQASAQSEFDRDLALAQHKEACHTELSLSMGAAVQKQAGRSRSWQVQRIEENKGLSPETRESLLSIVDELYSMPKLSGGTYAFYRFESCLIHHWFDEDRGSIDDVAESLLECQGNTADGDLEGLVACIDAELIRARVGN